MQSVLVDPFPSSSPNTTPYLSFRAADYVMAENSNGTVTEFNHPIFQVDLYCP